MAERLDVAARLAEGREALADIQTYLSACGLRGYRHPDLTAYGGQAGDWYSGEDGLDLRLLDTDCTDLRAAADAAGEALLLQRAQLDELAAAWRGPGADAALGFLRRHCDAGAVLAAGLRSAAQGCAALRDELWRLVDTKVATTAGVDERSGAQRSAWLAAAHAVTSGTADQQSGRVIDEQVIPYADNDIRGQWLPVMRAARAGVATAYDAAIAASTPAPGADFPIPGDLGPRYQPDEVAPLPAAAASVPSVAPVVAPRRPPADPLSSPAGAVSPALSEPDRPLPAEVDDPWLGPLDQSGSNPETSMPGGLGAPGGLGGLGGFGGVIPRLADALGGLLGSAQDGMSDPWANQPFDDPDEFDGEPDDAPADDADPDDADPDDADPDDADADDTGEKSDIADGETTDDGTADGEAAPGDGAGAAPQPGESAEIVDAQTPGGAAVGVPGQQPATEPSPETPVQSVGDTGETPCEIAADELPQVGR